MAAVNGEYIGRVNDQPDKRADWILILVDEVKDFIPADEYEATLAHMSGGIATLQNKAQEGQVSQGIGL